ncbi:MAG: HlyD family efflux transporter periplasmic adaptor subunit [Pirellulaceae bacterium]
MKFSHRFAATFVLAFACGPVFADEPAQSEPESDQKTEVILDVAEAQTSLIQNAFIAAPMSGVVAKVDVSEGDDVKVGSRLVLLRDDQARTELQAAQAAFEAARLMGDNDVDQRYAQRTLEVRQREYQQSQIANNNFPGTISETELEKLRLVVDQSRLAIEQAAHDLLVARATAAEKQAAVQIAEERLKKHGIETLVSGFVTEVDVEPGEWVEAGKPIVRVISIDPIRVECFVDGKLFGAELVGHPVRFTPSDSNGNVNAIGKVTFVSPELHPVTGQVRLWATIENTDRKIRAGMQGRLVIEEK